MNLEETIIFANNMVKTKYHHGMVQMGNLNDDEALEHNDPEKEAWNNDNGHYKIAFDHRVNDFFMTRGYYMEEESATYFTSPEIAREAITTIGRERILKYIFGVDCEEETND